MKSVTEPQNNFKRFLFNKIGLFLTLCILGLAVLPSCDKDDDEVEVKPSMEGNITFELPAYVKAGSTVELVGGGIIKPTQDSVTYTWTSLHLVDTTKGLICKAVVPDSIGTFSITLTATAEGYYEKSITQYVTSVKLGQGGSVTGLDLPDTTITDSRDGEVYAITEIGNLLWFAENLNWAGAGSGYAKADIIGEVFGRLYTWNEATGGVSASGLGNGPQGVCPDGWGIPTKEDWEDLAKVLNGGNALPFESSWKGLGDNVMVLAKFNDEKLWPYSPDCTPENMFKWAALSGGSCTNNYNNFSGMLNYGFWWSASEMSADKVFYRYIYCNRPDFDFNYTDKHGFGASVRCVKLK